MDHKHTTMTRVPQAEKQFRTPDAGIANCVKDLVISSTLVNSVSL